MLDVGRNGGGGEVIEKMDLFLDGMVVGIYVYGYLFAYYSVGVSLNCCFGGVLWMCPCLC